MGPGVDAQIVFVPCFPGSLGRYLRVQIVGVGNVKDEILTICELEVHGEKHL